MKIEDITLSETSQTEKNKYHVISPICELKKKRKKIELIDTKNGLVVAIGRP